MIKAFIFVCHILVIVSSMPSSSAFKVSVIDRSSKPILSYVDGTSEYQQVFNPSYVVPSNGTNFKHGLLIRTQNCSSIVGGPCVKCGGNNEKASLITFSEIGNDPNHPSSVTSKSIVFSPSDGKLDEFGTEDPRLAYFPDTETYYLFYTAYGSGVTLNLASTKTPLDPVSWTRHGPVFPSRTVPSKSGALLWRESNEHYLFWGDDKIRISRTIQRDPTNLILNETAILLEPRSSFFDSGLVESGPPPLLLSTGDYIFFYNSAIINTNVYNVGYVILDKNDPTKILQRSETPLLSPVQAWETGESPYTCNVSNVVFLEAATQSSVNNVFNVYYGAADATIGSAVIKVEI